MRMTSPGCLARANRIIRLLAVVYGSALTPCTVTTVLVLALGNDPACARNMATITRTARPPTVDGTLGPGEWDAAVALHGFVDDLLRHIRCI